MGRIVAGQHQVEAIHTVIDLAVRGKITREKALCRNNSLIFHELSLTSCYQTFITLEHQD
jgi:hypothetical protein